MNKSIQLSQLEVSLALLKQEYANHDSIARHHSDPATQEEARKTAKEKADEMEQVANQIAELRRSGVA